MIYKKNKNTLTSYTDIRQHLLNMCCCSYKIHVWTYLLQQLYCLTLFTVCISTQHTVRYYGKINIMHELINNVATYMGKMYKCKKKIEINAFCVWHANMKWHNFEIEELELEKHELRELNFFILHSRSWLKVNVSGFVVIISPIAIFCPRPRHLRTVSPLS